MGSQLALAPSILRWAEDRAQRSDHSFTSDFANWAEWVDGRGGPTFRQAEKIAKQAHVPFGTLFLTEPPEFEIPLTDFRLGLVGDRHDPSSELRDVIQLSITRQTWFLDYAAREGLARPQLPPVDLNDIVDAARRTTEALEFTVGDRRRTRAELRRRLRQSFESLGGLVVMTSMVGNDSHRPLDRDEFRGFALYESSAPMIFVNSHDDTLAGQFFTFFHELGHILRAENALDNADLRSHADGAEAWCNSFAAESLVPEHDLRTQFRSERDLSAESKRLQDRYQCSPLVILLRMRELRLIDRDDFDEIYSALDQEMREVARRQQDESHGGDFYSNLPYRAGERLSHAVITDLRSGSTSFTDAFRLLGVSNAQQIDKYEQKLTR